MKKAAVLLLIALVLISAGCVSQAPTQTSTTKEATVGTTTTMSNTTTTTSTTSTTTPMPTKTYAPIDFGKPKSGEILGNWYDLFDTSTIYVSQDLMELAEHYFPNASIRPSYEFQNGVAILDPKDARALLKGKPMLVTVSSYFGYVSYRVGYKYAGEEIGMMIAYKEDGKDRLIFTGNGKSGIGAALEYAMEIKGERKVNPMLVVKKKDFRGMMLKVIGDNDWDGVKDDGEFWVLKEFAYEEPFIFNWRVVNGENVTVDGGFIRAVNGSTVYIHALSFDVQVNIKTPRDVTLTYVIENTNPSIMELPQGSEVGDTWIKFTTNEEHFEVKAKELNSYKILVFGDHRPGSGTKPPEVFLHIIDKVNEDEGVFIIDGGDLVYSGRMNEWSELMKVWHFNKPVFLASGNHEYQGEGKSIYKKLFGPTDYSFSLGNYYYIFMDNTERGYTLSSAQWAWLEKELEKAKNEGKKPILIMHTPPFDPRPGGDHSMKGGSGDKLLALMKDYGAFGIFSHIHMYWYGERDGVKVLITGGGGAPLYVPEDQGGYYHYVRMDMNTEIGVEPVKVD